MGMANCIVNNRSKQYQIKYISKKFPWEFAIGFKSFARLRMFAIIRVTAICMFTSIKKTPSDIARILRNTNPKQRFFKRCHHKLVRDINQ